MTVTALHAAVIGWLRYERRCRLVVLERSPWYGHSYRPDIIGVNGKWQVIEVEFKASISDFKANRIKPEIMLRKNHCSVNLPWKFYFAVPRDLVERVVPLLCDGEGLLTDGESNNWGPQVAVVLGAKPNPLARPIPKNQAIRLVMHQTGTLHRLAVAAAIKQLPKL